MLARLSADTGLLRDYGAACTTHADDLYAVAARLRGLDAGSTAVLGPVGARFVASLVRCAESEARTITRLSGSMTGGARAATGSADAYDLTDDDAGARIGGAI